jgi:hypothetical protein
MSVRRVLERRCIAHFLFDHVLPVVVKDRSRSTFQSVRYERAGAPPADRSLGPQQTHVGEGALDHSDCLAGEPERSYETPRADQRDYVHQTGLWVLNGLLDNTNRDALNDVRWCLARHVADELRYANMPAHSMWLTGLPPANA